jgi:hypothetical protein
MPNTQENFTSVDRYEKRSVGNIIEESKTINPSLVSSEVLEWVTINVENFIDDNMKVFKLDLVLDATEGMQETKKLQDLYRSIPDESIKTPKLELEKLSSCRRILDEITEKVHYDMTHNEEAMNKLFERMIFYYEKIIPNPDNKKRALEIDAHIKDLIDKKDKSNSEKVKEKIQKQILEKIDERVKLLQFQKFEGKATIPKFEYESFEMDVMIRDSQSKEISKQYHVPEGFSIWIELSYGIKKRQTAMF